MKSFKSFIWKPCDVQWLSFIQTGQYGVESIVAVSFRTVSFDFTAGVRFDVLIEALDNSFDWEHFDFRLLLNLYHGS